MLSKVNYRYCPQCGSKLIQKEISLSLRPYCEKCTFVHWGSYSLGVGGVLWRDNKVLLIKRAQNPGKGMWTIPGGFVEQKEKIDQAIVREIYEETGIKCEPVSILAVRDRPTASHDDRHDIFIIFLLKDLGNDPVADKNEVSDIGFFSWEECASLGLSDLTKAVIQASRSQQLGLSIIDGVDLIGHLSTLYVKI